MDIRNLVERAIEKAGGVRPLSRAMEWDAASVVKARDDAKLSPYRAARLATFLDEDAARAIFAALADISKSEAESDFWLAFPSEFACQTAKLLDGPLRELESRLSRVKSKPNADEKAKMLVELIAHALTESWSIAKQPAARQFGERRVG